MTASHQPSRCTTVNSAASRTIDDEVSISGYEIPQLVTASRARARDQFAFLTSTTNSSPSVCTAISVDSCGRRWSRSRAAFLRAVPLTPSAYTRTFVSSETTTSECSVLVQLVASPSPNGPARTLRRQPIEEFRARGGSRVLLRGEGNQLRNGFSVGGDHERRAAPNFAKERREAAIRFRRRNIFSHVVI